MTGTDKKSQPPREGLLDFERPTVPAGKTPREDTGSEEHSVEADRQEVFLPVSGFVWLFPEEVMVVDHPAFQRLGRVHQLGQTHLVYRGATHKRIEHALGTVHVVQRMINALKRTSEKAARRGQPYAAPPQVAEERFIRLGALLHDIGHVAAGHTVEDELGLIPKHDGDHRLALVFDGSEWVNGAGETLGQVIDEAYARYIPTEFAEKGIKPSTLVRLLIRKIPKKGEEDPLSKEHQVLNGSSTIRLGVCRDLIGNTICADLLDYIHRDWYHIGKPRPFDERILQYMEIRSAKGGSSPAPSDQYCVSLGRRPKIRTDAVSAILELLEWRYQLAESVLFHRTKLAAAAMLDRALFALWSDDPSQAEETLLPLSDEQMLVECERLANARGDDKGRLAEKLLTALKNRSLFAGLATRFFDELPADVRAAVVDAYCTGANAAANRARVLEMLEKDFDIEPGSLAMYCPPTEMNVKIAAVKIAVGDVVQPFNEFEKEHGTGLSGGHLEAQIRRFQRLWRIHFFIDRRALHRLGGSAEILRDAIYKIALNQLESGEGVDNLVRSFALRLIHTPDSPWQGRELAEEQVAGAFRDERAAVGQYPWGAPSIRRFIKDPSGA